MPVFCPNLFLRLQVNLQEIEQKLNQSNNTDVKQEVKLVLKLEQEVKEEIMKTVIKPVEKSAAKKIEIKSIVKEIVQPLQKQEDKPKTDTDLTLSRGLVEDNSKRSYKGVFFTNTFKVNRSILLVGLSFFGPHQKYEAESAPYQVTLEVHQMGCKILKKPIPTQRSVIIAKRGEKFRVNLVQVVNIRPNLWYDIKFELNGPETGHIKKETIKTQCIMKHEDKQVLILDSLLGSCQMSDYHFLLH